MKLILKGRGRVYFILGKIFCMFYFLEKFLYVFIRRGRKQKYNIWIYIIYTILLILNRTPICSNYLILHIHILLASTPTHFTLELILTFFLHNLFLTFFIFPIFYIIIFYIFLLFIYYYYYYYYYY